MNKSVNMQNLHTELLEKANEEVRRASARAAKCSYRLKYHFMAPANWLNDPNGLIQFHGDYHLFYQHHPYSPEWGPMHWGHAKSRDLVHWEHQPIALAPSEEYDMHGCFSGSAVNDHGTLSLLYTGNVEEEQRKQVQCLASSNDGIHFTKYSGNPVISEPPADGSADFRDPKVWQKDGTWYMVLGSTKDGRAKVLLYRSPDLRNWEYVGVALESETDFEFMWECPDLFALADKHVLIVSPMIMDGDNIVHAKSLGFVGDFAYDTGRFSHIHVKELDYGFDFYASQTFQDDQGRRILIGWMDIWSGLMPTKTNGWSCAMTLPRVVSLADDGTLRMQPVPELQRLRSNHREFGEMHIIPHSRGHLGSLSGDSLEILAEFEVPDMPDSVFGLKVRCSADGQEYTLIYYDTHAQEICVDRNKSGLDNLGISRGKLPCNPGDTLQLHIFLDTSSIEVFANDGRIVLTNRIYPDPASLAVDLFANSGTAILRHMHVWTLNSVW